MNLFPKMSRESLFKGNRWVFSQSAQVSFTYTPKFVVIPFSGLFHYSSKKKEPLWIEMVWETKKVFIMCPPSEILWMFLSKWNYFLLVLVVCPSVVDNQDKIRVWVYNTSYNTGKLFPCVCMCVYACVYVWVSGLFVQTIEEQATGEGEKL